MASWYSTSAVRLSPASSAAQQAEGRRPLDRDAFLTAAEAGHAASAEWDAVVRRIRSYLPGVLAVPVWEEVRDAARDCPLAYVVPPDMEGSPSWSAATGGSPPSGGCAAPNARSCERTTQPDGAVNPPAPPFPGSRT